MAEPALVKLAKHNDVVVIADQDHTDGNIPLAVQGSLAALRREGVRHLFIEQDPQEWTPEALARIESANGRLIAAALKQGIEVHLCDDRSRYREREARFPEEDRFVLKNDPYRNYPETLIANAPNPEKMRAYLQEENNNRNADIVFRNQRMVENIDVVMKHHRGERAVVMLGAAHTETKADVDEGLRASGYRVATAEINSPETSGANLIRRQSVEDMPDLIIKAETGEAISFKVPHTNTMKSVRKLRSGEEIPWQNQEPVQAARDAAKGVNLEWAKGALTAQEAPRSEVGQMAPAAPHKGGAPKRDAAGRE